MKEGKVWKHYSYGLSLHLKVKMAIKNFTIKDNKSISEAEIDLVSYFVALSHYEKMEAV